MRSFFTAYLFLIAAALTLTVAEGWLLDAPFYLLLTVGPSLISMVGIAGLALGRRVGSPRFWGAWFHFAVARFVAGALAWMLEDTLAGFDWSDVLAIGAVRSAVVAVAGVELFAVWLLAYQAPETWAVASSETAKRAQVDAA